jgi:hypothetical protein
MSHNDPDKGSGRARHEGNDQKRRVRSKSNQHILIVVISIYNIVKIWCKSRSMNVRFM